MIHKTALVSPEATLGKNVEVGPYAIIEANVAIQDNCKVGPRATVLGHTTIGEGTVIHTGAVLGDEPQDFHYEGDLSYTEIGANCIIREYVTVHRGVHKNSRTVIGDGVMLMGLSHIAHNATVGSNVILANGALVAGHVEIGAGAFLSGNAMVHQFARVGRLAMVGGGCRVRQDLPPFCLCQLDAVQGLNNVGLKRAGLSLEARKYLKQAYKIFFRQQLSPANALQRLKVELDTCSEVQEFITFIETTERGIMKGRRS